MPQKHFKRITDQRLSASEPDLSVFCPCPAIAAMFRSLQAQASVGFTALSDANSKYITERLYGPEVPLAFFGAENARHFHLTQESCSAHIL